MWKRGLPSNRAKTRSPSTTNNATTKSIIKGTEAKKKLNARESIGSWIESKLM